MDDDLTPFIKILRTQRIVNWVIAPISIVFGVLILLFLNDRTMSDQKNLILRLGVGGGMIALGVVVALQATRPPERNKALRTLLDRAADVVWVCPTVHKRNGMHVRTSYALGLIDGRKAVLYVAPRDETAAVASLRRRCPRARFGYDPEWEKLFKTNPGALRLG